MNGRDLLDCMAALALAGLLWLAGKLLK